MHITIGEIMKNLKHILTSILVMLAVCAPLMLTGCTKYYNIEVFIRDGVGGVYRYVDNTNGGSGDLSTSIAGTIIEIGDDENFKYEVGSSSPDYEVTYIKVNGSEIYNVDSENNRLKPDESGYISCNIEKITKDIKIEVAFRLRTVYLEYWYKDDSVAGGYSQLKVGGAVYTSDHKSGEAITLASGYEAFDFKLEIGDSKNDFQNGVSRIKYVSATNCTGRLYTDKTEAELKSWLGLGA